jgi:hypothetical protein
VDFLVSCRTSYPPEILAELRSTSDWVWSLRRTKLIRDWTLRVLCSDALPPALPVLDSNRLAACKVSCRYTLALADKPFALGLILGLDASRSAWKAASAVPAYLHQINCEALPAGEREAVMETFRGLLAQGHAAWASLFSDVHIKVAEAGTETWHDLDAGDVDADDDHLIRFFHLPEAARPFVGNEVTLDLGFRSVRPTALNDFALQFPWLTSGFSALIIIDAGTEHVIATAQLFGDARPVIDTEDFGKGKKIRIEGEGQLVLPGSTVHIKWLPSSRRKK